MEEDDRVKQPYRELNIKAKDIEKAYNELKDEHADEAVPVLWEELLDRLNITALWWSKHRDFSDMLLSPDDFKSIYHSTDDKDYRIYVRQYKDRLNIRESIAKTEQRLGTGVIRAGFLNPRIQTYCIWLSKQRQYGGYSDRADPAAGDVKITVKLEDDKGQRL